MQTPTRVQESPGSVLAGHAKAMPMPELFVSVNSAAPALVSREFLVYWKGHSLKIPN